jgi:hypothetical protein
MPLAQMSVQRTWLARAFPLAKIESAIGPRKSGVRTIRPRPTAVSQFEALIKSEIADATF